VKDIPREIDTMIQEGFGALSKDVRSHSQLVVDQAKERRSQFACIGHQAIDAMVKSAEDVVARAEEGLKAIKERAIKMRIEMDERDAEITEMMARVTDFGRDQLSAHAKFNGQITTKE
jgi:hypothetical protein